MGHPHSAKGSSNFTQDKDHGLAMFPGHTGKEKDYQPPNIDNSQRKQVLLQQSLPQELQHAPAFIFPLHQQHAAAATAVAVAASVRPGSVKSLPVTSSGASSSASNLVPVSISL
ncbi:hypothetical protein RIF29_22657 [Crotalaria pallida]|uniref:Uncharacterized protein n=1 Tax=Crotalaria pallida TaxID=3830 RepID=A0AAN9IEM1_CROPI